MVEMYLADAVRALGIEFEQVYQLGLNSGNGFNMTCLALRGSRYHNGVSRIHGSVAAQMECGPVARDTLPGKPDHLYHQRRAPCRPSARNG